MQVVGVGQSVDDGLEVGDDLGEDAARLGRGRPVSSWPRLWAYAAATVLRLAFVTFLAAFFLVADFFFAFAAFFLRAFLAIGSPLKLFRFAPA